MRQFANVEVSADFSKGAAPGCGDL